MKYIRAEIPDLWIIEPTLFSDERGYFMETYKKEEFDQQLGERITFIQDNESMSSFGVLRGLHFQRGDAAQAKLVRVIDGKVLDVAVDIRPNSSTFGKYVMVELSSENKRQLFIPKGFAHGYLVLSEFAIFSYKVDNLYSPGSEGTLYALDAELGIPWTLPLSELVLSEKDKKGLAFKDLKL